jgi:rhodanese-related sulfurtransferase
MKSITVQELNSYISEDKKLCYIDVRSQAEFTAEHISKFRNIPLDQLETFEKELSEHHTIVLSCATGIRSAKAYKVIEEKANIVLNVEGGLTAWNTAGFDTVKGSSSVISVMRQVQIVVGLGVLLGVILSQFYHINFIWVSAFFGAGLLFSGVTNTCALAVILGKMSWNK